MRKKSKYAMQPIDQLLWGASISAHQVEGGNHNQWSVWELESARALAKQAEYKKTWLPRWSELKKEAIRPGNYVSGKAADHYHRFEEDFKIARETLHLNSLRFSIEWSRIQPDGPKSWDHKAVDYYRTYLKRMRESGLEPVVTLWHFSNPVWFEKKGGFEKYNNIVLFRRYAERIVRELGEHFRYIIPINEPDTYIYMALLRQEWPPQKSNYLTALQTYLNLHEAHRQAYRRIKKIHKRFEVGYNKTFAYTYRADDRLITKCCVWLAYKLLDDFPLARVRGKYDFIGVNYYFATRLRGIRVDNPEDEKLNDLGWGMQPQFIGPVIRRLWKKYKRPILITESGVADDRDKYRTWWLQENIKAILTARQQGVPMIGYLHWSLIDNFEWSHGLWPRFGLVEVDYKTSKRTPRKSALWYGKFISRTKSGKK